jgi:deazaflavin-dependent oxidoreductase (nitroreductase family)
MESDGKSVLRRTGERLAASRPGSWLFLNVFPHIDRVLLRLSRGYLSLSVGQPVVLLETRGARSGARRSTPLMCMPTGEQIILIASNAGGTRHPGWYFNLRKNPEATVTLRGQKRQMVAHDAVGSEREDLWKRAVDFYGGYAIYQQRAGTRQIPVVVLSPVARS